MQTQSGSLKKIAIFILLGTIGTCLFSQTQAFCLERPRPGEIALYKQDGSFSARMDFVKELQNHRFHPGLIRRNIMGLRSEGRLPLQRGEEKNLPYDTGLPSHGSPKILVLLIEFPNYPHETDPAVVEQKVFGEGDSSEYPYESLTKYYQRSSYGALAIQGNVLGWYMAKYPRGVLRSGTTDAPQQLRDQEADQGGLAFL